MPYDQDLAHARIHEDPHFASLLENTSSAITKLEEKHRNGLLPVLDLPHAVQDIQELESVAAGFRFPHVFVLGTGGSSLGGRSLCDLVQSSFCPSESSGTRVHFLDNIDPHSMDQVLNHFDFRECGFLVISKSGNTAETLCQFLNVVDKAVSVLGKDRINSHFIVITEPGQRSLRSLAGMYGIPVLDHHPSIGGRFSVLSLVGLLPAVLAGVNIRAVRDGARNVLESTFEKRELSHAAKGAAFAVSRMQQNLPIMVMMPYCDRLQGFSSWYRQLWAESVGKDGLGSTPVPALGTVDQHSQLQLFLDGPRDKAYTLVFLEHQGTGRLVSREITGDDQSLSWLTGKTMGDLMEAEQQATAQTLINHGCPVRIMKLKHLDEVIMGALFMHFMMETMISAELMGIDAYNQPAVEESKILTRKYLSGMGVS